MQYKQYSTATSGTVTMTDSGTDIMFIHDAGLTLNLTIAMPANPFDGQLVCIVSVSGITALTMTTAIGTIINLISSLSAGVPINYIYDLQRNKWYKF